MLVREHSPCVAFLPWPGLHMTPTEPMLQGNRISPHLISVSSPIQEIVHLFNSVLKSFKWIILAEQKIKICLLEV